MGQRALKNGPLGRAKRSGAIRLFTRLLTTSVSIAVVALVGIQFARIIRQNVAMADSLHNVQRQIVQLDARKIEDERAIHRLLVPEGAVPEIHERLRMVVPNQALIYIRPGVPR